VDAEPEAQLAPPPGVEFDANELLATERNASLGINDDITSSGYSVDISSGQDLLSVNRSPTLPTLHEHDGVADTESTSSAAEITSQQHHQRRMRQHSAQSGARKRPSLIGMPAHMRHASPVPEEYYNDVETGGSSLYGTHYQSAPDSDAAGNEDRDEAGTASTDLNNLHDTNDHKANDGNGDDNDNSPQRSITRKATVRDRYGNLTELAARQASEEGSLYVYRTPTHPAESFGAVPLLGSHTWWWNRACARMFSMWFYPLLIGSAVMAAAVQTFLSITSTPYFATAWYIPLLIFMFAEATRWDRNLAKRLYGKHFEIWFLIFNAALHVYAAVRQVAGGDLAGKVDDVPGNAYLTLFAFFLAEVVVCSTDIMPLVPRTVRLLFTGALAANHARLVFDDVFGTDFEIPVAMCLGELCSTSKRIKTASTIPLLLFSVKYFMSLLLFPQRLIIIKSDIWYDTSTKLSWLKFVESRSAATARFGLSGRSLSHNVRSSSYALQSTSQDNDQEMDEFNRTSSVQRLSDRRSRGLSTTELQDLEARTRGLVIHGKRSTATVDFKSVMRGALGAETDSTHTNGNGSSTSADSDGKSVPSITSDDDAHLVAANLTSEVHEHVRMRQALASEDDAGDDNNSNDNSNSAAADPAAAAAAAADPADDDATGGAGDDDTTSTQQTDDQGLPTRNSTLWAALDRSNTTLYDSGTRSAATVATEPLQHAVIHIEDPLIRISFFKNVSQHRLYVPCIVAWIFFVIFEAVMNVVDDTLIYALLDAVSVFFLTCELTRMDRRLLRTVASHFTFWFILYQGTQYIAASIYANYKGSISDSGISATHAIIFSHPAWCIGVSVTLLADAMPRLPQSVKFIWTFCMWGNLVRLLSREIGTDYEPVPLNVCVAGYCTNTRFLRSNAMVTLLIYFTKFLVKLYMFPSNMIVVNASVSARIRTRRD
jgi:hypothetical protein